MAGQEQSRQAEVRFRQSIVEIRDSGVEGVSTTAGEVIERIQRGDLSIAGLNSLPAISGFGLMAEHAGPFVSYKPTLFINPSRVAGDDQRKIQADLAGTVAVAVQYPYDGHVRQPAGGFERRLPDVYEEARAAQTAWLNRYDAPADPDPRTTGREEWLRTVIGDPGYYTNVGFGDWQNAVDFLVGKGMEGSSRLLPIRDDVHQFLIQRTRLVPITYSSAISHVGEEYKDWDPDFRAHTTAVNMAGIMTIPSPSEN